MYDIFDFHLLERLASEGNAGKLEIKIPIQAGEEERDIRDGVMRVNLTDLIKYATTPEIGDHQIMAQDIEAVSVIGKALYKHFDHPYRAMRKDLDMVVLLTNQYDEKNIVIPKRTVDAKLRKGYDYIEIIETAVYTEYPEMVSRLLLPPEIKMKEWVADLHISYRSLNQFRNGIGHGDSISESVVSYGVPIIGIKKFNRIVDEIQEPVREPLHETVYHNNEGNLDIEIIPK